MLKEKIVAITGSAGFVGSGLVKRLRSENVRVMELDLKNGIDITNWQLVENIDGIDILIHLAARTSVPESFSKPKEFLHTNINGTLNMLELCRKCNARMIFASSSLVYGIPSYLPVDEMHPINGTNPYATSKIVGEELCKGYYRSFGLRIIIVRPFNIYGAFQISDSLISTITKQAKEGKIILRDPSPRRDYLYIDDIVDAYLKLCEYTKSDFEIFNIGMGKSYSVEEVASTMVELLGNNIEIEFTHERRVNEIDEIRAEITKARTLMNWHPRIDLKMGIQKVLDSQ
jgi:nucleoside-diphosphate-sugar epimerase